jgi:thioesterase domain-containing protein
MLDTNPTQIQQAPAWNTSATPLFLLHDGGGTIFNYFMLGNLGRDVYGIHDTKFDTEEGWKGGLTEMASLYVSLIKSVRVTGPILLGG